LDGRGHEEFTKTASPASERRGAATREFAPQTRIGSGGLETRPGGDDQPHVYSGTLVVSGHGLAVVRATGHRTALGRIGEALAEVELERTPLQREVDRLVRKLALVAIAACALLVVTLGLAHGDWLRALLPGLTLAMALLPEEFPVVLTVFHAFGGYRISKHLVLARRLPAVEALGATTVLCSDKTGTLTVNAMRIARLEGASPSAAFDVPLDRAPDAEPRPELPESVHAVVEYGILASQADPFDPMEAAFHALGRGALAGTEHLHEGWRPLREYPLSPELLAMSHVYDPRASSPPQPGVPIPERQPRYLVAAKGAPEAVFDLCHLPAGEVSSLRARVAAMASRGLRVLAVARAELDEAPLPAIQHDYDFELVGLVGLLDPVRAEVPAAVAECRAAGVRVVMITGDAPETAAAIGADIGLRGDGGAPAKVTSGAELDAASDEQLRALVRETSIFARVVPEQKLRLVRALMANGEVVAMTGDGVNDAPALRAAHIGVAMGKRGTDVAREAASLVLVDDCFTSIVRALRLGRGIYDNLRKAMAYVLAVHVPIAGMALLPPLFGLPMVLAPTHVAFLELVIDPACSIAFEAEPAEGDVMRRPPRRPDAPLFDRRLLAWSLLQGLSVLAIDLVIYALARRRFDELAARTLAFVSLVAGNLGLIHVNRSWTRSLARTLATRNVPATLVTLSALAILLTLLSVPALRAPFHLAALPPWAVLGALLAGAAAPCWFEIVKRVGRTRAPG
jgi:Ca2+-transporting ATPase